MKYLRNRRRLAAFVALAVVVGVTGFLVVPALASSPGDYVNPAAQPSGLVPVDKAVGGNGDCSNLFGITTGPGTGYYEYDNANPKTGTGIPSGNNDGVTFDLTVASGRDHDKYFSFKVHGAGVVAVGVNGGSDTTLYDYRPGAVQEDGAAVGLHAPATQNGYTTTTDSSGNTYETPTSGWSSFYSLSHLTFCYTFGTVHGTVYQDATPVDGTYTSGTDTGLGGWTINLYDSQGTKVGSATSATDGTYSVAAAFAPNTLYTLCEVPPSGTWAQTEPGSGGGCSGAMTNGQTFTPTSPAEQVSTAENFGNVPAVPCTDPGTTIGSPTQLELGNCKQGQTYVFTHGFSGDQEWVGYWVGDQTQPQAPIVEHGIVSDPISSGQPKYSLKYSEQEFATLTDPTTLKPVPFCQKDPRDGTPLGLQTAYKSLSGSAAILPTGEPTCAISVRYYVGTDGNGYLEFYAYSLADMIKGAG